jgi:chaperonin GroEL
MSKQIEYSNQARKKLSEGIDKIANAVTATLGPNGRNVVYRNETGEVRSTKDGVTVAKIISLKDPVHSIAVDMLKQAAIKTANIAGDGTTTATLLAQFITNQGLKALDNGGNAVQIKRDIDKAVKEVIAYIKENIAEDITSEGQLDQIASVSANNDPEVGSLITSALAAVGRDGIVTIEESRTGDTYLETVEGIQFDRGFKSPHFVTDNATMSSVLDNPLVLIYDGKLSQAKDLLPILESVSSDNKSLLIICEDIDNEALATLIVNKMRGTIKVCAVKAPDFGDRRKLIMEDIAVLTGGQVISPEKGMKLSRVDKAWLGEARKANIQKESTTIIDGKGEVEAITSRIEDLKAQIDNAKSPFEMEKLQERLAKFTGGVSIIHVGGNSELEMKEKKDRVEDALHATRAAIAEGIVPGGGIALLRSMPSWTASETSTGYQIIYMACTMPFYKILTNAGYEYQQISDISGQICANSDKWTGWNLTEENVTNLKDAGIIDPFKVTRTALENAASVAGTILLTECVVADELTENGSNSMDDASNQLMLG